MLKKAKFINNYILNSMVPNTGYPSLLNFQCTPYVRGAQVLVSFWNILTEVFETTVPLAVWRTKGMKIWVLLRT